MKITEQLRAEARKFDPTKPVQTRNGKTARIVCTDAEAPYTIVALIEGHSGDAFRYTTEGNLLMSSPGSMDLINVPAKFTRELWVNIYPQEQKGFTVRAAGHATRERADIKACSDRIACVKVTIEGQEGDGL